VTSDHVDHGAATVLEGEHVGQRLGRIGASGYATGPSCSTSRGCPAVRRRGRRRWRPSPPRASPPATRLSEPRVTARTVA